MLDAVFDGREDACLDDLAVTDFDTKNCVKDGLVSVGGQRTLYTIGLLHGLLAFPNHLPPTCAQVSIDQAILLWT